MQIVFGLTVKKFLDKVPGKFYVSKGEVIRTRRFTTKNALSKLKFVLIMLIFTMILDGCSKSKEDIDFQSLEDLNKPQYKIAAPVGAASEPYVAKTFPNAVEKQFTSMSDMIIALENKQVDAIVFSRATLEDTRQEKSDSLKILPQSIDEININMAMSPNTKLENLQNEINEYLKAKKADGTLEKAYKYWFIDHNTEMPADIPTNQGANKKLIVGTTGVVPPATFYSDNKLVGFDIEFVERFAAEYGYEVEFRVEDVVSMLNNSEFGRIDIIGGSLMNTPERAERVIFPETPFYTMPISVMTRKVAVENKLSDIKSPTDLNDAKFTVGVVTGKFNRKFRNEIFTKSDVETIFERQRNDFGT